MIFVFQNQHVNDFYLIVGKERCFVLVIGIINYGLGNVGSIHNMLRRLGIPSKVLTSPKECEDVHKLILPGVGAFDYGMQLLTEKNWIDVLNEKVIEDKYPILGICLGMQLMTKSSEEGSAKGLGWINAVTKRFNFEGVNNNELKIPHMGWNIIKPRRVDSLFRDLSERARFYFVHSYYVECENEKDVLATCTYGIEFTCAVQHENIYGVQFHPEKSHKFGMQVLKNFAEFCE